MGSAAPAGAGRSIEELMSTLEAWRGIATRGAERAWPVRWARGAGACCRVVIDAAATLGRFTAGVGLVRIHCLLAGHGDRFVREPGRLRLQCEVCGRSTQGWTIATSPPRVASPLTRANLQGARRSTSRGSR